MIIKAKAVFAQTDLKVGTSPGLITPSAVFEVSSTNKGILIPRMTTAQMNAISSPANGLMIFNTDKGCMHLYNGVSWRNLCLAVSDSAWSLLGNSGTVASTNFLGTRDAQSLVFKTNNSTALTVPVEGRGGQLIFSNNRYGGGGYPSRVGYQDLWSINSGDIDTSFSIMGSIGADDFFYIGGQAKSKTVSTSGELHIVSGDDGDEPIIFEQFNYATTTINERLRINNIGHVGIGISTPQYKLDIDANSKGSGNPLRLLGLQAGATTDSILTSASGVVRRMAFSQLASNTSWDLLGNSGTVDGTNFIGTTDNVPFNIRVNNQKAGRVASNGVTLFGYQAGNANTTMNTLTAYGYQAGFSNTTALNGYFSGYQAGYSNTTGNYNYFSGYQAGYSNTTGTYNHFSGYQAGYSNNGSRNTFIGPLAGQSTTTNDNTAIGYVALRNNTTGFYNIAVGGGALGANTTGSYLVAMGYNALGSNTTGTENTGLGHVALSSNTTGGANTALGSNSLRNNTTGGYNTAMGYRSLVSNTIGNNNVGIGYSALDANLDGHSNTAIGVSSMITNTSGNTNTAVGRGSLYYNTTGVSNNALGADALYNGTTGSYNIGIGQGVAYYNQTGNNNIIIGHQAGRGTTTNSFSNGVFIGYQAGYNNGAANNNNFIGYQSGLNNTTGTNNSFIGYLSGNTNTTGSNNTLLGHNSNVGAVALTNATAIGANAVVGASNSLVLGGTGASAVNVGINTTTPQYKLDIDANNGSTGNPLRLLGLQSGATTDSILTSASGVVRRLSITDVVSAGSNSWSLIGNGGTTAGTNFLGTTDSQALVIKTFNTEKMRITPLGNVGIGTSTPNQQLEITAAFRMPNTTSATTGVIYKDNLPFIHNYKPSANDGNNTFIGLDAGNFTMSSATSTQASNNTGVGASVLKALTTGFGNTAIGRNALTATTAGAVNVAIGNNALAATTTGSTNVAIGGSALELNTTGSGNVAIGFATLSNSTTTSTNTAVGMTALRYNTSGTSNTAVGNGALTSNTTGNTNTAVGESALYNNTIGIGNSAFGQSALSATTSGSYNTAFGLSSLQANTTGAYNIAMGYGSMVNNSTGSYNVSLGTNSFTNLGSSNNVGVGYQAGNATVSGGNNTFLGYQTGLTNASGSSNTLVGYRANVSTAALTNATALGANAIVGASNSLVLGGTGTSAVNVGINTTTPQYKLDIDANAGSGNPLRLLGLQAGAGTDSILTSASGVVRRMSVSQLGNGNFWKLGGNTEGALKTLGTLDNYALPFVTNNTERMRITSDGKIGVGTNNPDTYFNIVGGDVAMGTYTSLGTVFPDSSNKFIIMGDRTANSDRMSLYAYYTGADTSSLRISVGDNGGLVSDMLDIGSLDYTNLRWYNWMAVKANGVGIGTTSPAYKLDIVGSNPLRLIGLNAGATTDSILTSASGVVRRMSFSQMSSNTSWALLGNSGTVDGTNFIGTTDNVPLNFGVNNQRAGRITNDGITLLGYQAGNATSNTSSTNLTALGYQSGYSNTTGLYNYFGGYQSGYSNTTGSYNHFVGYLAGYSNTTGANNQFIGYRTGYSNTTGSGNLFLGVMSGANNATGNYNTFLGHDAGRTNTTGSSNLFFGQNAGSNNTVGNENLYMGHDAGFANIGNYNIMIGNSAGSASATTNNTVMIGYRAGYSNLGNDNQFMGYRAGFSNTTGINNSFIGYQSGSSNITGSNNTLIGYASNVSSSSLNNAIAIGANAIVGASNSLVLGGTGTSAVNVGINTTTPQYKLDIDANAGGTGNPLRLLGLQAGASTDSILTSASGVVRRMSFSQLTNGNFWKLGGNTEGILRNIGTTDNYALPIITNNVERMRITETGNIGIGTNSPAYKLDINGTTLLRNGNMANGTTLNQLLLGWNGASDYLHAIKTRHNSGSMSGNAIDFYVWRQGVDGVNNTVGTEHIMTLDGNVGGSVGIGTTTPLYKLDIDADNGSTGNPLRLLGLQAGATTDSILTSASGVVRRMSMSQLGNGNFWKLGGNTESALRNLGTTNNYALPFITNNTERMRITETGNVGIGTTNPVSKLSIVNDGGPSGYPDDITIFSYGTSVNPGHDSYSARGTASAPLNLQNGDPIGRVVFNGYYNGGFNNASMTGMQAFYRGSGTDVLTSLHFLTSGQYNMTLDQTGKLGIGTTTPAYKLDVVGSDPLRLIGLNAGATTDSILTSASGVVRRMSMNQLGNGNFWKLGGNTEGVIRNLGTTDNVALPFITNNTERMRIMPDGKIGVGTNNPDTHFNIVGGDVAIGKFTGTITTFPDSSNKLFFRGDRGNNSDDMYLYAYYQPGELSSLRINVGDNGATAQDFLDIGSSDYANLRWYNWMTVRANGVGIGTTAPAYKLDIVGSDPLRLIGLNAGATTDSILTSASGVVRRMAFSQLANNSSWSLLGNSGTVDGTNFLGTTDNVALNFRANNQKAGRIGITNRETFFGYQSGNSNTFGTNNTAFGYQSLFTNTTGQSNTAIGYQALYSGFSTSRNTAIGFQALYSNSTGSGNTSLGAQSMYLNGTGFENVSIGDSSLYNNGTGGQNVSIGKLSMLNNSTGQQNVVIGYRAGQGNVTGANNTLIGTSADVTGILTNATAIGNGAIVDASNKIRLGNTSVTLVETYGSIVTISDLRLKKNITDNGTGLKFIKDLRPVHYELKDTAHKGIIYDGFIAQEIEGIMKKYNLTFSGLSKPTTEGGHYTVNYATFVVPLVNAVKELDVKNEQLADENARLKAEVEKMKAENATLKTSIDKNTKDIEAIKAMLEAKNK